MCGIVGFTGQQQAAPILLEGLSKLEYRGYDSAGLAVRDGENLAEVVKSTGKLRICGEDERWAGDPWHLWDRPYQMGDSWGAQPDQCPSPRQRKLYAFRLRPGGVRVVGVHNGLLRTTRS